MKHNNKLILGFAPALVGALATIACGSDDGDDTSSSSASGGCTVSDSVLTCDDGTSYNLSELAGSDGERGPAGEAGEAGEAGDDGTNGRNGDDGADGVDGNPGSDGTDGADAPAGANRRLIRLATVPLGAEVTGAFLADDGTLFFNAQHPDDTNDEVGLDGTVFNTGTVGYVKGVNFNELPENLISSPVPESDNDMETVVTAYGTYQTLIQTGDLLSSGDEAGVIMNAAGDTEIFSTDMPDMNVFISTGANEGYLFTNWESVPGGVSRVKLVKTDGAWEIDETTATDNLMVDFGPMGTMANCFGSLSPWGTPLTSEEWGNTGDATRNWNDPDIDGGGPHWAIADMTTYVGAYPNPYQYQYIVEVTDPQMTAPGTAKRYAMGRYEHENAIVMPDQRTAYLSQDNTDGVFFKFVADTAGDLSSGTLYAAKVTQDAGLTDAAVAGFDIEWIELANGNDTQIKAWIDEFNGIDDGDHVDGQSNYLTDDDAAAWAAGDANYPSVVNGGGSTLAGMAMDDRIAFLESRKAARALGATAEWRKFEGIYANQLRAEEAVEGTDLIPGEEVTDAYVYFAISDVDRGMTDGAGDIQLDRRVGDCGGVYRMRLEANYDVSRIEPVIMGATARDGGSLPECDVDGLAQPDNVIVMNDGRIIIGEDGGQQNNTLWLF